MGCAIKIKANGKDSELQVKLAKALNSETRAENYMAIISGEDFKEKFGDWEAAGISGELTTDMESRMENLEPQLHRKKGTNQYYFELPGGTKFFVNRKKIADIPSEYHAEIIRTLSKHFLSSLKDQNNNTDKISPEEVSSSIEKTISDYLYSIENSKLSQEYKDRFKANAEMILKYKDDFVREVIIFSEDLTGSYAAREYQGTIEEEDTTEEDRSNNLGIGDSFEVNPMNSASANIKIMLSQVEDVYYDGSLKDGKYLGLTTFIELNEVYKTLLPALSDVVGHGNGDFVVDVFDKMKDRLKTIKGVRWMDSFINKLDSMSEDRKTEFVQAFSMTKINFYATEVDGKSYKILNATSTNSRESQIVSRWGNKFQNDFIEDGKISEEKIEEIKELQIQMKTAYRDYANEYRDAKDDVNEQSVANDNAMESLLKILYSVGVFTEIDGVSGPVTLDFTDVFFEINGGVEKNAENVRALYDSTKRILSDIIKNKNSIISKQGVFNNPIASQKNIKNLAQAIGVMDTDIADSNILANGGKSYYTYSNPTYISNKLNEWKEDIRSKSEDFTVPTLLEEMSKDEYTDNSVWRQYFAATDISNPSKRRQKSLERIEEFEQGLASTFKSRGLNDGSDNKDIDYIDAVNDSLTKILGQAIGEKSYFPTLVPADKSRKVEFTGPKMIESGIQTVAQTGEVYIPNKTIKIFSNYFLDEYNRMKKVAREISSLPENELVQHYHIGNKNGLKSQLFPDFSFDSTSDKYKALRRSLYDSNGNPITTSKGMSESQISLLEEAVKDTLVLRVNKTMLEINDIPNKNKKLVDHYNRNYNNGTVAMAGDYLVNGLVSTVEFAKMFSGDPAYYKNPIDLIKRIPATYTDGQYLRLSDKDSLVFNHAVIKGVEVKSRYIDKIKESLTDKSIADAYGARYDNNGKKIKGTSDVNTSDAQAWITPRRWKFIKQRLGQWGPLHRSAFAAMESGRKMSAAELKVAAQPLKGVYFEINDGRPVYLKYSQAVLLPNLVKGTPMEAVYNKMVGDTQYDPKTKKTTYAREAKDEIHEVITEDGVKVGAVAPTRINVDGTTELDPNFELNSVELSNRGWKLQQDLPIKKIHETNLGSQVQRTILSGMVMSGTYEVNGESVSGEDLLNMFHDKVKELSDAGKERLTAKFSIVDGKIQDMGALYDALIKDLRSTGGNDNIIAALEKETDFEAIPQIKNKVQSLFMSMMNKEVIKISTNGGSFIQVSPFGLESQEGEVIKTITKVKKQAVSKGFELNEGQKKAKEDILNFLNDKTSRTMSLIGYAGTGKTTLLREVFEEFDHPFTNTVFSSPTHKANAVIKKSNPDYNVKTLHSLLGLTPDQSMEDFDATNLKFTKAQSISLDVLVIDESSMINDDLFDMITSSYSNAKILFVGDDAQIRPVKQNTPSKALTSAEKTVKLTEVMRANNNEVLQESMEVRNNGDFSYKNKSKNGIEFTNANKDFLKEVYDEFKSDAYKENPLHVRILAGSNSKVKYYNEAIRKAMFPGSTDIYQEGATLMAYSNYKLDYVTKKPVVQNASDHVVVKRYEESVIDVEGMKLKGRYIDIKDVAFSPKIKYKDYNINRVFALSKDNDFDAIGAKYEEIRLAALRAPRGQSASFWQRLSSLKDAFVTDVPIRHNGRTVLAKTFDSGYAHTVHKSQGSTYENVFIDENDIDNTFRDDKIKAQLKYVAVTRASDKATVLTNKNIEEVPTEELIEETDNAQGDEFINVESETFIDSGKSGIKIVSKNYDGKGLQPPRMSEDGKTVLPGQIMMPHTDAAKLLKSLGLDITKMTGEEIMEKLDPSALEVIGYRIPNQGMSSNDYLEIVGILPEGMGDSMLVYDAIPGKTGSDFDIDKMFLMMNNLEVVNGKITKVQDVNSLQYKQNEMIDLYRAVLSSPLTYDAMMTSIDSSSLKNDITDLFPTPEAGNLELFSPVEQIKTKFDYSSGAAGLGSVANQLVDHVAGQSLNLHLPFYLGKGTFATNSKGDSFTTFDKLEGNTIANTLSSFLNAYVDIAKDPYISRGNYNSITSPVALMLVRAGYDVKWVNRFIGQPILQDLVKLTQDSQGKTAEPLLYDKRRVKPIEYLALTRNLDLNLKNVITLNEDNMESEIVSAREDGFSGNKDMSGAVLGTFEIFQEAAKELTNSILASKAPTNGAGGSALDLLLLSNKIAMAETGMIKGFKSKFKNTALGAYNENSIEWIGEVLDKSDLFFTSDKKSMKTFNYINRRAGKGQYIINKEFARALDKSLYSYVASGTELFTSPGSRKEELDFLLNGLPSILKDMRENNVRENFLLKELQFNKSKDGYEFVTIDSKNKPKHYQNKIYSDWLSLYESKENKQVAVDLVKYSFATSGFANNLGQFFTHIPHEILQDLGFARDIVKFKKNIDEISVDNSFLDQFLRNNSDNPSIVDRVSFNQNDIVEYKKYSKDVAFSVLLDEDHDTDSSVPFLTTKNKKGEIILYKLVDETIDNGAVYVREPKLGYKSFKGSVVEYAKDEKIEGSSLKENALDDKIQEKVNQVYLDVGTQMGDPDAFIKRIVTKEEKTKLEYGDLFGRKDVSLSNEEIIKKNLDDIIKMNNIKGNKDC